MHTISDASDMTLWGWQVWFLLSLSVVTITAVGLIIGVTARPHKARLEPGELSAWDKADQPRCELRCGNAGTITRTLSSRVVQIDHEVTMRVCPGHSDEGTLKGWWTV